MLSVQSLMQDAGFGAAGRRPRRSVNAAADERRRIAEVIDRLPETSRLVLGLRYYEAVRPHQIAAVLGLSVEEVRDLLAEAARTVVAELREAPTAPAAEPRPARGRNGRAA